MNIHGRARSAVLTIAAMFLVGVAGSASHHCYGQQCSDPMPPEAACTAVRPLGEMDGCACFVCFAANGNRQQTVCTRDQNTKEGLLKKPRR
jgi:hypothetical protein